MRGEKEYEIVQDAQRRARKFYNKEKKKNLISLMLVGAMASSMVACGGSGSGSADTATDTAATTEDGAL